MEWVDSSHRIIGVPLIHQGFPVGALLMVTSVRNRIKLDDNTRPAFEALGKCLATHIYLHWLLERWSSLVETAREITIANTPEEVLSKALSRPKDLLDLTACWGFWRSTSRLALREYVGPSRLRRNTVAREVAAEASTQRVPLVRSMVSAAPTLSSLQSFVSVPLVHEGHTRAVLVFGSKDSNRFGEPERFFLQNVGQTALSGLLALDSRAPLYALSIIGSSAATLVHDLNRYGSTINSALVSIRGTTEVLGYPAVQDNLHIAEGEYQHVNQLLVTIGTFIGQLKKDPTLARERVPIPQTVEQIVAREQPRFSYPYIQLQYKSSGTAQEMKSQSTARCNSVLLDRFLVGLMQNALASIRRRATDPRRKRPGSFKGVIEVCTEITEQVVRIVVRDNGMGFMGKRGWRYRPDGTGFLLPLAEDVVTKFWTGAFIIERKNQWGGATITISLPQVGR